MTGFKVTGFVGALPGKDPRLIEETFSTISKNQRVESGALDPLRFPRLLKPLLASTKYVYRIPNGANSDIGASYWIEFEDPDTDMVRTPVVNDGYKRYYWASPSTGFKYATEADLISGGSGAGLIGGVARPTTPVTLDVIAGTGFVNGDGLEPGNLKSTRSYIVTFVSDLGEEGAPGPAAEAIGYADQDWRLRDIPQPVIQNGYTDIATIRVYRTVTAASGATVFNRVVDLAVGTTIYVDRISDLVVSGNSQLDSTNADPPPSMDGIALMPNGVLVGFKGNNLFFSENYKPHSWPAAFTLAVQYPVVGLGVSGNTCVVMTAGNPAAVTGASGAVMSLTQSDTALPCVARQSIVVAPEGVYYATMQGLVLYGPSGPAIVTDEIFGRQIWEQNYNPPTIDAALFNGGYAALRTTGAGRSGFIVPVGSVVELDVGDPVARVGMDIWSNKPWLIQNQNLYEWFPISGTLMTALFRSKVFVLPDRVTMGVAQVYFDQIDRASVQLTVFMNGVAVRTMAVQDGVPVRLPAGKKHDIWQFEVQANTRVHSVAVAQTITDLRKV